MQILLVRLIAGPEGCQPRRVVGPRSSSDAGFARGVAKRGAQRDDIDPGTRALVVRVLEKMGGVA